MACTDYDLVVVGGGLAGTAIGKSMAERGARVLILEREKHFRDPTGCTQDLKNLSDPAFLRSFMRRRKWRVL